MRAAGGERGTHLRIVGKEEGEREEEDRRTIMHLRTTTS